MFSALSGPVISSAYVDPVKVVPGDTMHISADVQDSSGVSFVTARMPYESGADILNLSLASGTVYDGIWIGEWLVHDTDIKNYTTTITAENILGESSVAEIEWSDPAGWYDSAWNYRRPVTIDNSGSALIDYQVNLTVSCDSDMQPDFDDIRFTSSDGTTLISHWRESYIDSDSAVFWVKVPSIPAGDTIIYMYYGNSGANSASDGANTFGGDLARQSDDATKTLEASQEGVAFYSVQFRHISGDSYEVHVYDKTYDSRTYGRIILKDEDDNVLKDRTYGSYGNYDDPGSYDDPVTLTDNIFSVYLGSMENSGSSIFFGTDRVVYGRNVHGSETRTYYNRKYASSEPTLSIGYEENKPVEWYDSAWFYRRPIILSNTGSELTDYSVKITLPYDSDMQPDFDDIRFTSSDCITLISHWRESYVDSDYAVFWVKVPLIPAGGTTIYTYYGNSGAISESNFSSISQDFWINQTSYSATPSIQTPYDFIVESDRTLWGGGQWSAGYNGILFNYTNPQDKFTINFTTKFTLFSHPSSFLDRSVYFFDAYAEDNNGIFTMFRRGNTMYIYDGSVPWSYMSLRNTGYSKNIGTMNTNTEYDIGIDFDGTTWRVYVDDTLKRTITQSTYKSSPVGWVRISGRHCTNSYGTTDTVNQITIDSDSFYQNQYAASEPITSIGTEENNRAAWYDSAWFYRKPVTITGYSSDLIEYQVNVTVAYDSDMQSDFDDIRFTLLDGTTLISHWRESYVDSDSAVFWVKVPFIPASGTTIYMYYGNSGAGSASDGEATFEFFDDFEGGSINGTKWEIVADGGSVILANSIITIQSTSHDKDSEGIRSKEGYDFGDIMETYVKVTQGSNDYHKIGRASTFVTGSWGEMVPTENYLFQYTYTYPNPDSKRFYSSKDSVSTSASTSVSLGTWNLIGMFSKGDRAEYLRDGGLVVEMTDSSYCPDSDTSAKIFMLAFSYGTNSKIYADWARVRKYVSSGPVSQVGEEEEIDMDSLQISFVSPTPDDGVIIDENYVDINVTATDESDITAFIDWDNSLVGWWRFNEETDFTDYSTYSNDVTNGGSLYTADGKFGGARSFDGVDDYLERSFDTDFTPGVNGWTVEGWVKAPAGSTGRSIVNWYRCGANPSCNTPDSATYSLSIDSSDKATWNVRDDNSNGATITSSVSVADNFWHHIVGTFDPTNDLRILYVDGIEVGISYGVITSFSDGGVSIPLSIGRTFRTGWGSPTSYFNGTIDEVKIWNRALTLDEIKASYNAGLYRLEANFTNLADGTYTYTAHVQDISGNINQAEIRTVIVDYEDVESPEITIKSPNPLTYSVSSVWFNVSLTDSDTDWCGYSLDGAENVTMNKADARNFYMLDNSMAEAEYTVVFYCNDTSGNMGLSEVRSFEVNYPPHITVESPENGDIYFASSIWFNVTLADSDTDWCGYSLNGTANVTMETDDATHFYFLNETIYKGNHDVVFYCNDSNGFFSSSDKIYFDVQYECLNFLDCPAGAICASHICIFIRCTEYCTNSTDLVCHAECNGTNGCLFYDATAMSACEGMPYNQWVKYGADKIVKCCDGALHSSYEPDVVYAGLNPFTINLGEVSDVAVSVRNRNDFEDTFTISLESTSNLRYWSWFSTHKNDEERMSMDVSFKPYEQKFISLRVLGGTAGCFKGIDSLKVNSTSSFGESEVEYIEVCVKPAGADGLFNRSVPGLGDMAFVVLLFLSAFLYSRLGNRHKSKSKRTGFRKPDQQLN